MSVAKRGNWKTFRFDFTFLGKRYSGNTYQVTEAEAQLVEREKQLQLRHQAGGVSQFFAKDTQKFSAWAVVFVKVKTDQLARPDHVRWVTAVVLRFFGKAPKGVKPTKAAPYHDLYMGDVIANPDWILKFETWMRQRKNYGAQSRNHARGMMRRMYSLAMQPQYRQRTGITTNPFLGLETDQTFERTVILDPAQVVALLSKASYHVRLAIAIAALAPKLRLANILALEWSQITPDPRRTTFDPRLPYYLTVHRHKTARKTRRPMVSVLSAQLLEILKDAHRRAPDSERVVTYRGVPVKSIRGGMQAACQEAGITYGRSRDDGATFHTIRHSAATLISLEEPDPLKLRDAIGHTDLTTTLKYRHMRPSQEMPAMERLSKQLDLVGSVTANRKRAARTPKGRR